MFVPQGSLRGFGGSSTRISGDHPSRISRDPSRDRSRPGFPGTTSRISKLSLGIHGAPSRLSRGLFEDFFSGISRVPSGFSKNSSKMRSEFPGVTAGFPGIKSRFSSDCLSRGRFRDFHLSCFRSLSSRVSKNA